MVFRDNPPIHLQIANHLCEHILLKKLNSGDSIPSVKEMAVNIEVNPNLVRRTFNYLEDKDIISNKQGQGYFISEDSFHKTRIIRKGDFVKNELMRLFKEMSLLSLSMEEVNVYYLHYTNNQPKF